MGNSNTTIQTTNIDNSNGGSSGDSGQTNGTKQTDSTQVPITVPPVGFLSANLGSKAKSGISKINPSTIGKVLDTTSSLITGSDKDTASASAPFVGLFNQIGSLGAKGDSLGTSVGKVSSIFGTLGKAYDTAHTAWTGGQVGEGGPDAKKGWFSAFDDVTKALSKGPAEGDDPDTHEQLLGFMKTEQSAYKKDPEGYTANVQKQVKWIQAKKHGQDWATAYADADDSDDEEDKTAKQTNGKQRKRSGKLQGLRNLGAMADGSVPVGDDDDNDTTSAKTNGAATKGSGKSGSADDDATKTNGAATKGSTKSKGLPIGTGKAAKKTDDDDDDKVKSPAGGDDDDDDDEDEEEENGDEEDGEDQEDEEDGEDQEDEEDGEDQGDEDADEDDDAEGDGDEEAEDGEDEEDDK